MCGQEGCEIEDGEKKETLQVDRRKVRKGKSEKVGKEGEKRKMEGNEEMQEEK